MELYPIDIAIHVVNIIILYVILRALLWKPVKAFMADREARIKDQMDQAAYRKAAVDAVRKLSEDVGIPSKLEALKEEDLPFLAESAHADACAPGNPKDASIEDLTELFRKLM